MTEQTSLDTASTPTAEPTASPHSSPDTGGGYAPHESAPSGLGAIGLKTILVPMGWDDCSLKAVTYAVALAKEFDASVILLHIVEELALPMFTTPEDRRQQARLRGEAEHRLVGLLKSHVSPHVSGRHLVREGRSWEAIVKFAAKTGADLIVISTHGSTGFARFFNGSVAEQVVRHARCPVLVVREKEHDFVTTQQRRSRG